MQFHSLLVRTVVASASSLSTATGRPIRRGPLLVETFGLQPLLVLVPPLLPLDVVIDREIAQITARLVVVVADAHVVPTLEASRSLCQ